MKVRISQTVHVEEVPIIINKNMEKCRQDIMSAAEALRPYYGDLEQLRKDLTNIKETLSLVDMRLEDTWNLATGLEQARTPTPDQFSGDVDEVEDAEE